MADHENDTGAPAGDTAGAPSGDEQAPDNNATQGGSDDGGEAGDGGDSGDQNGADEGNGDGAGDGDVPTRRHNQANAAARVATRRAQEANTDGDNGGDAGAGDDLATVKAELADIRSREEQREDEAEIQQVIKDNPDMAQYAEKVRGLATHESRKQVPITSLFYEAAGADLMKIGARRAAEAGADAAEGQNDGTSAGASGGVPVNDMSAQDFKTMQDSIRHQ